MRLLKTHDVLLALVHTALDELSIRHLGALSHVGWVVGRSVGIDVLSVCRVLGSLLLVARAVAQIVVRQVVRHVRR
jgi:hypothetical protein